MISIASHDDQHRSCRESPAAIAKPVGERAASGRHQVMEQGNILAALPHRVSKEVGHERGEYPHRNPVEDRLHQTSGSGQRIATLWTHARLGGQRFVRRSAFLPLVLAAIAVSACQDVEPAGQVVASVNGTEITVAELNEEAQARGLSIDGDGAMRDALVKELVERKLLVEQARDVGVDRTPNFLLAERRQREILLAQQLLTSPAQTGAVTPEQLRAFVASHPLTFSGRVIAQTDQLSVTGEIPPVVGQALRNAATAEEMAQLLRAAGVSATRARETWDSADPSTPLGSGEVKPTNGSPFFLKRPRGTIVGTITAIEPSPVPAGQQLAMASALIQRELAERRMRTLLDRAARSAKVSYNPEFAPGAGERTTAADPPSP